MSTHRSFHNHTHNGNHQQRGYNSRNAPNYQPSRQYDRDDYIDPDAYEASFAQYVLIARQFRNGYHQQRGYNSHNAPSRPNYQPFRQYDLNDYINPYAYDASFAQYEYIAQQFRNGYHHQQRQQRVYNSRNAPRRPNYQPSRQYDPDDYINPGAYDASFGVNNYPPSFYQRIDNDYRFQYVNYWNRLLNIRERNSRFRPRNNHDHEEKEIDYGSVLKYLKIRTHYAPEVVVTDVESDTCAICQSEYENEENIGALQCGHEYHTDCIKQWLLKKKNCPMCRASVVPSQEQRLERDIYSM